jgi:hypothetical protein
LRYNLLHDLDHLLRGGIPGQPASSRKPGTAHLLPENGQFKCAHKSHLQIYRICGLAVTVMPDSLKQQLTSMTCFVGFLIRAA